jgi:hypothetical protein
MASPLFDTYWKMPVSFPPAPCPKSNHLNFNTDGTFDLIDVCDNQIYVTGGTYAVAGATVKLTFHYDSCTNNPGSSSFAFVIASLGTALMMTFVETPPNPTPSVFSYTKAKKLDPSTYTTGCFDDTGKFTAGGIIKF